MDITIRISGLSSSAYGYIQMIPKTYSIPLWWNGVEKKMLTPRKSIIKNFYFKDSNRL